MGLILEQTCQMWRHERRRLNACRFEHAWKTRWKTLWFADNYLIISRMWDNESLPIMQLAYCEALGCFWLNRFVQHWVMYQLVYCHMVCFSHGTFTIHCPLCNSRMHGFHTNQQSPKISSDMTLMKPPLIVLEKYLLSAKSSRKRNILEYSKVP